MIKTDKNVDFRISGFKNDDIRSAGFKNHAFESAGFTLIELVAILIIVAVISVYVLPATFNNNTFQVQASRDEIVAALFLAQQTAMARDSSVNPIQFVAAATSIDIRENGVSLSAPGIVFPFSLPPGVSITSGIGTYQYDKLGRFYDSLGNPATLFLTLQATDTTVTITVSESGYAE